MTTATEPVDTTGDVLGLHRTALAVREHVLAMGGDPVGALSATDILVALYREVLRVRPEDPRWPGRDHFVLGKGDASTALHATLAECGFFPVEDLSEYGRLPARPAPGVEFSVGSFRLGAGLALAAKRTDRSNRVFVLADGDEPDDDLAWEAARGLDNLTVIVDRNRLGASVADRLDSWFVSEVDGHDFGQLVPALRARAPQRPTLLLADTSKGRGMRRLRHRGVSARVVALRAAA